MMSRIGNKGFTLVEVLVATVVLSVGIVFIYQSLFTSLDAFDYYQTFFTVAPWVEEKIWTVQEYIKRYGSLVEMPGNGGVLQLNQKKFQWELSSSVIDESQGLYQIDFSIGWKRGKKEFQISRTAYARYELPQPQ